MKQPAWDDAEYGAGTMVKGALWLVQVVGEGNTFTKTELREAFPGISQVDRRIRDLRDYGWVVYTSTEDATLSREDQRFVKMGAPVWDPKARRAAAPDKAVSSKDRQAAMARDGYMCTLCGIAGGEPYPDDPVMTAVLAVSRKPSTSESGRSGDVLVTECKRCRAGGPAAPGSPEAVVSVARELDVRERRRLLGWMERGRRGRTELDRAWAAFLRVPEDARPGLLESVKALGG